MPVAWTKTGENGEGENREDWMDSKCVLEINFTRNCRWIEGEVEGGKIDPAGDTQVSGLSTWYHYLRRGDLQPGGAGVGIQSEACQV